MRKKLSKWLPSPHTLEKEPGLQWLKPLFKKAALWQLNHNSIAKGVAVGLFVNFLPIPLQIIWAALLAFICRANLPLAIALTWINNPFTFIPINFFIYQVGEWALDEKITRTLSLPTSKWHWEASYAFIQELLSWILSLGRPYLTGLFIVSISSALIGYFLVQATWGCSLIWHKRKQGSKKSPRLKNFSPNTTKLSNKKDAL